MPVADRRRPSGRIGLAAVWLTVLPIAAQASGIVLSDDFEAAPLDRTRWSLANMMPKRHWIDRHQVRDGKGALAIRIKGSDVNPKCTCQMVEVREAPQSRVKFGAEAWYGFSFRIDGRAVERGDTRWQIAAWKQETDGSPFLAQRFDQGVFHITLESGNSRVLVATAEGEAAGFIEQIGSGLLTGFGYLTEKSKYDGKSDVKVEYAADPILPDPRQGWVDMVYRIKGGLAGNGVVEVYANGRFIARATGTIGVNHVGGDTQYFRFGHNRAAMPTTSTLYLDRFRRGPDRMSVEGPSP